jgi:hypothetical protein
MAGQIGGICVSVQLAKECDNHDGGGGDGVQSVTAEAGEATVDNTDPQNPIVGLPDVGPGAGSYGGGGDFVEVLEIDDEGRVVDITTAAAGGGGLSAQVDVFTADGTYTKPADASIVRVVCIGAGAGGGSGRRGAAGSARGGGGGGQGGSMAWYDFDADDVGGTESVIVGEGGAGGTATSTNDTNGTAGTNGEATSFGSLLSAAGGTGGGGGTTSGGNVSTFSSPQGNNYAPAQPGSGSATASAGSNASFMGVCGAGGGGGGGISSGNATSNGGNGSIGSLSATRPSQGAGAVVATSAATNGGAATANTWKGGGGGGGGAGYDGTGTNFTAGGNGGLYGAGGGGGGATLNGQTANAGGNGANGICVVITFFTSSGGGGGGTVDTIVPGPGIDVDDTDAENPIVSNTGVLSVTAEAGETTVGGTAQNPTVGLPNVGPGAGIIGEAGKYFYEIELDAQGRVTGAAVEDIPANPGVVHVETDSATATLSWSGLTGDNANTGGYQLRGRIVADGDNTQLSLRFNNDSANNYLYNLTRNDGIAVEPVSASGQTGIILHGALLDDGDVIEFVIDIPLSKNSGTGFNIDKTCLIQSGYVVGGEASQMKADTGTGRWGSSTQVTRLDIVAESGGINADGTQVSLYRYTR